MRMLQEGQKKKDDTNAEHRRQAQERIELEKIMSSTADFVASETFRGAKAGAKPCLQYRPICSHLCLPDSSCHSSDHTRKPISSYDTPLNFVRLRLQA